MTPGIVQVVPATAQPLGVSAAPVVRDALSPKVADAPGASAVAQEGAVVRNPAGLLGIADLVPFHKSVTLFVVKRSIVHGLSVEVVRLVIVAVA